MATQTNYGTSKMALMAPKVAKPNTQKNCKITICHEMAKYRETKEKKKIW